MWGAASDYGGASLSVDGFPHPGKLPALTSRHWRAVLVALVDLAIVATAALGLWVMVTGGGVYHVWGIRISSLGARNPLIVAFALLAFRLTIAGREPFVLAPSIGPDGLELLAASSSRALHDWLSALSPKGVRWLLVIGLGASMIVKASNILYHYGFYYGDDVEIHTMTFSVLLHRDLGVWNLRSPFYPLAFVYPLQRLLRNSGFGDPFTLIAAGRFVVACFSLVNLWLVFRIGQRIFRSTPIALLSGYFLWLAHLQVRLGSSEEPRTVSTTFLLVSFFFLAARPGALGSALAGVALGIAASIRFSEGIFLVPLALLLGWERRFRSLSIAVLAAGLTSLLILGPGDRLYWPSMFFSLRNILDFTLVKGLSSRGYEPFWQYLVITPVVTDLLFVALVLYSFRFVGARLVVWSVVPLLLLSLFPHKEERYLLPLLPFWALCAGAGFWRILQYSSRQAAGFRCYLALYLLAGVTLFEIDGWRFRRFEGAVDVARALSQNSDVRDVAMQEAGTVTGATLYLAETADAVNIDSRRLCEADYLKAIVSRPTAQYVVLSESSLGACTCREVLAAAGYIEQFVQAGYAIFLKSPPR